MKAIEVTEYGGPEVLRLVDLPKPSAGPGEVVVKLAFVGINFKDVYMRTGVYKDRPTGPSGINYEPKFPFVLGLEGAGTVEELGAGVEDLALGDRVAFMEGIGAYAEYVAVPDWRVVRVPDAVSLELAAATQLQAVRRITSATASPRLVQSLLAWRMPAPAGSVTFLSNWPSIKARAC